MREKNPTEQDANEALKIRFSKIIVNAIENHIHA